MNENDKQAESVGQVTSCMQQNGSQCFKSYSDDALPIGAEIYATAQPVQAAPAVAVNEQMLRALVKTKTWFDAEENHELEPDFYNRCGMCDEAQSLISEAIAAAEAAKGGV